MSNGSPFHRGRICLIVGCFLLLSYLADALVDTWFTETDLLTQIFRPNAHELAIRSVFLCCQLLLLAYILRLFRQRRELDERLTDSQRAAELERSKAEAILEALGDGISIQDRDLRILYQNKSQRSRMGERLGEFCYRAYQGRDEVCPECHLVHSFADGQSHTREATAPTRDGVRHFEIVSTPLFDEEGQPIAGIEAVRDITARKEAEARLREMTAALHSRSGELEEANAELEAFGYSLSHDLRNHLARLSLAAESLQQHATGKLDGEAAFCLDVILQSSEEMESLVEAMLVLSKVSRQELRAEEVDLSDLAGKVADELLRRLPADRSVAIDIAPGLAVRGDAQMLNVALVNLLGNACKYTHEVPQARIRLSAERQGGRQVFAVADNGVGFDMREAEKLFRPFQRLSGARDLPGVGVGLATVERVVRRHGGEIWAQAEPGAGATFYFTLAGDGGVVPAEA